MYLFFSILESCQVEYSQKLTTNEVRPGADLGGDTFLAGQLLVHALSEEKSSLQLIAISKKAQT